MDKKRGLNWSSVGQLALGLLTTGTLWSTGIGILAFGVIGFLTQAPAFGGLLPIFLLGVPLIACGILMLPSIYYPLMRILGRQSIDSRGLLSRLKPGWWILALPPVILLGHLIVSNNLLPWLLLPPLHLLAVGIPTAWMLYLAVFKLPVGSSQRMWGSFGSGLTLAPFLIMLLEVLAALFFLVLIIIYLAFRPELADRLMEITSQLQEVQTPEVAIEILSPVISHPLTITLVILFGALVVPLLEELVKPIGVLLLAGRRLTPQAGFTAGAFSGAGYAFIESLLLSSNAQQWAALVIARIGTSAVHILTTALVGWALVQTWQRRQFLKLILAYCCAVTIHGLWNGLTLVFSFDILSSIGHSPIQLVWVEPLSAVAPFGLAILSIGCFLGLMAANRHLRSNLRGQTGEVAPELAREESG